MRKRLIHIADSHFDETSRFEECKRLHHWIADDIAARAPDVILHAGDVFEGKSTPAERRAVADVLKRYAELAPVVIVRGNHDVVGDLSIFARLRTKHPIVVEEACGVHHVGGFAIGGVAWPRKAELLATLGARVAPEEASAAASEALRGVILGIRGQLANVDAPSVLLIHAMVNGSVTSTGQPLVGMDMELGLADLALAGAHYVALGHIHKGQDWIHDAAPIVYPGSPRRTNFGEVEDKGYIVADFEGGDDAPHGDAAWRCAHWERVLAPATPMLHVDAAWTSTGFAASAFGATDVRGAELRYRYTVDSDVRDAARAAAHELRDYLLAAGAVSVKVEEVVRATTRARAPEVAAAPTLEKKLRALWAARGDAMDENRKLRVLARLPALEG